MKRIVTSIAVAGLAFVGMRTDIALAQLAPQGPPMNAPPSAPLAPRQPAAPVVPQATSRPSGWPGGPVAEPKPPVQLTPEEAVAAWYVPKEGIPKKFKGTDIIARVGTEVILASEVLVGVEETISNALASGKLPANQETALRYHLMRQRLPQIIETKILLIEARREIPDENMAKIEKKVKEIYEQEQIPKLIDGKKIKSRSELIRVMREAGTSLEDQERQFLERSLAAQYIHKKIGDDKDKEVTHEEMLAYYRQHVKDYETPPRARWEQIMVRFSNYPSKADAFAKIAAWGNEVFSGAPLADVARKHSDDLSSEDGGMHEWTTRGALASEELDRAIFSLPTGQLSPILEDKQGFHIIRVVEREELSCKSFSEMQPEIKKQIRSDREGAAMKAYIANLREKVPVWTIFDTLPPLEEKTGAE